MDETSAYDKIIVQCKSNDVDTRVEALSKLQAHFSKGIVEVADPEALLNIFKTSLRTSNLHLTNAALSALPAILPSLITRPTHTAPFASNASLVASSTTSSVSSKAFDVTALRSALSTLLPTGGIIDRLGDKEKAQAKARETLVLLGGYAFRAGGGGTMSTKLGKGQESPLTFFERVFKEGGLGSKVWKVREQAILTLVHIRRAHHLFPIRPYLSHLVDCLEDTDAHVRDCARQSVVELFTGPAVSDAARADLKKEMSKKGVRKAIVDDVLAKLLSKVSFGSNPQSHDGSENGEATVNNYVPPSLALQGKRPRVLTQVSAGPVTTSQSTMKEIPRPGSRGAMSSPPPITPSAENVDVVAVYIASTRDLENEFAAMQKPFEGKETEHNWAARERAIQLVRGMLKGDVHNRYSEHFMDSLKDGFIQWSLKTLASLRTTVAMNTCLLYVELAVVLGPQLDPLCDTLFTSLLKMSGFTKKITAQQSQSAITAIISHTSPQPRLIVPLLWTTLQEKNTQSRTFAVSHFKHYLDTHGQRSRHTFELSGNLDTIEKAVKKSLADPNPGVRELARTLFWVFAHVWKERGMAISNALDPNALKQLEKACPSPEMHVPLPSTPGGSKKSSVAAAIAASRAKAKAMATAPPALRHRTTSGPGHENLPKGGTAPRSRSPVRASTSPPSPTLARFASSGFPRSTSAGILPKSSALHTRTISGPSDTNSSAISPSASDGAHRRISSSISATNIRRSITNILVDPQRSTDQASQITHGPPVNKSAGLISTGLSVAHLSSTDDESLLMAQSVPVPEDSDSEDDAINVLSFSAAMQQISPQKNAPNSPALTLSPASDFRPSASVSNALSTDSALDIDTQQPIIEDALRARAEQAESAAERLLELVEPEDDPTNHPTLPPSLLKTANEHKTIAAKPKSKPAPLHTVAPQTPDNRANIILKKAALFTDSPVMNHSKQTSLLDVLRSSRQETGWWLKRKALSSQVSPLKAPPSSERVHDLQDITAALEDTVADVAALKRLAIICMENPIPEGSSELHQSSSPTSPISKRSQTMSHAELWETNQTFEKLFRALMTYLHPSKTEDELAYGLIVIWEALENQSLYLDGKESELFSTILRVRYCNKVTVLEGTNAIRDMLTLKLDPVYGLTTLHANLKVFHSGSPPSPDDEEVKAATYAFGLMALGKFILRLPAEIAEEELPRLKGTLTGSLNDRTSLIVRESAAAAITAAQLVLRDETHLFTLLDGLTDEKKNLLTYLFDKHGARNLPTTNGCSGMERLERELRRLDTRTSTPLRGSN